MIYQIAEKFKSIQGEGTYAGTPMAFIRFVGCSVGKKICHGCDTDFERTHGWRGGGDLSAKQLVEWTAPYAHICLTGGEPLDQELDPLLREIARARWRKVHIETSGTKPLLIDNTHRGALWLCVSPKPGWRQEMLDQADEIKVIVPTLGSGGPEWPQLQDALRWAAEGRNVFIQPRNAKHELDRTNLGLVLDIIKEHPQLKLSTQLHKILKVQ